MKGKEAIVMMLNWQKTHPGDASRHRPLSIFIALFYFIFERGLCRTVTTSLIESFSQAISDPIRALKATKSNHVVADATMASA